MNLTRYMVFNMKFFSIFSQKEGTMLMRTLKRWQQSLFIALAIFLVFASLQRPAVTSPI
jgi:hypothetical protein